MAFYLCESCKLVFTTSIRKPIALPCGHTFCLRCIRYQYTSNNYFMCVKCSIKHRLHYDHYSPNYAILEKIHSNNTIYLNNFNSNDSFGNRVYNIESFSIIKGTILKHSKLNKQNSTTPAYPSLYNYFEVMKRLVFYPLDSKNCFRKFLKIVYIPIIIFLLLMINYLCLIQMRFSEIFLVISILYESEEFTNEIVHKAKLWMCFVSLLLINHFIEYLWITTWSIGLNVVIVIRTLYVILVLGNDNTLNTVAYQLFTILNELNLLVK